MRYRTLRLTLVAALATAALSACVVAPAPGYGYYGATVYEAPPAVQYEPVGVAPVQAMREAGADIRRIVAVGGGTQGSLWLQVVSDVTGLAQEVPGTTIGASYGAAFLAAVATAPPGDTPRIAEWNPVATTITPDESTTEAYDALFDRYLRLYASTKDVVHELARCL